MRRVGARAVFLACLVAALSAARPARAGDEERRGYLDRAATAYALGRYAVAAENYEKAYEARPDAGVLYNAAQAHRLAGNKERALTLYQSYLRMYGTENRAVVEQHIENLKQAIDEEQSAAAARATSPLPAPAPAPVLTAPPPAKETTSTPVLVAQPPAASDDGGSIARRPWFWVAVGGVVAAAAVTVFLVTRSPADPSPTIGSTDGN
jgi:tetratricopeptide (TPR) repeat protein